MGKKAQKMRSKKKWYTIKYPQLRRKLATTEERERALSLQYWEATRELSQLHKTLASLEERLQHNQAVYDMKRDMYKMAIDALLGCLTTCHDAVNTADARGCSLQEAFTRQRQALRAIQDALAELEQARLCKISNI